MPYHLNNGEVKQIQQAMRRFGIDNDILLSGLENVDRDALYFLMQMEEKKFKEQEKLEKGVDKWNSEHRDHIKNVYRFDALSLSQVILSDALFVACIRLNLLT